MSYYFNPPIPSKLHKKFAYTNITTSDFKLSYYLHNFFLFFLNHVGSPREVCTTVEEEID